MTSSFLRHTITFLILATLTLLATWPLWSSSQFFYSDDGLLHLFRALALDATLRDGVVFPRWVFDLAFGYGYPIFDFYPPLASYVAETFHIAGWGFVEAVKGAFILIVAIAATGAYKMGTELFDRERDPALIGILTSIAFVFFPYSLINIYTRGALAEALAMALLPWLVWSLERLLKQQTVARLLLTAVLLALLLYAHSLTLLMSTPVLGLLQAVRWLHLSAENRLRTLLLMWGVAVLSAALGAAYWLPFVSELPLVKMGKGIPEIAGFFSTTYHFFSPSTLIQFSPIYRYGSWALGLVPVVLGICGAILAVLAGDKLKERVIVYFFTAIALAAALAMLESSRPIWQQVPLATMVQYPWRVSSLIALSLAIVIGSLPVSVSGLLENLGQCRRDSRVETTCFTGPVQPLTVLVVAVVLIVSAVADLSPQVVYLPEGTPTFGQLAELEKITGFVGTTTFGEYMPNTVQVPDLSHYAASVDPKASPADIQLVQDLPTRRVFIVSAIEPLSVSLRVPDFAGWQATVDNQSVTMQSVEPVGILAVNVPSGMHQVTFSLENTLPQQIGNGISIVSIVFVLSACICLMYRRAVGTWSVLIALGLGSLAFLVPTALALSSHPPARQPVNVDFSPELRAIGFGIDGAQLDGDTWHIADSRALLQLSIDWQVKQSLQDKPFTWRLEDERGHIAAENTQLSRYGTGAPASWIPNEIVGDRFDVPLDAAIPAGRYTLQGTYGDHKAFAVLGNLVLEKPVALPTFVSPPVYQSTDAHFGDSIQLLGYNAPRLILPGTRLDLTLYWKVDHTILDDDMILVQLLDVNDKVAVQLQYDGTQVASLRVPSLWGPGKIVRDAQNLTVPSTLKPGIYHWAVVVYRTSDGNRLDVSIGSNPPSDDLFEFGEVQVPMNLSDVKPQHVLNAAVGQKIRLLGYDLAVTGKGGHPASGDNGNPPRVMVTSGQMLTLQLYWQALSDIGADYKVFVHIQDPNGKLVAQHDSAPDEWRYPTRIWRLGERVTDPHALSLNSLAAGVYTLTVGMYAPDSGERLPIVNANGQTAADQQVLLGTVEINRNSTQ